MATDVLVEARGSGASAFSGGGRSLGLDGGPNAESALSSSIRRLNCCGDCL